MRALAIFLLGLAALSAQQFLSVVFALDAFTPDVLTVLLLWLGVSRPVSASTATMVALLGLLADGFAGSPLGLHLLHGVAVYALGVGLGNRVHFQGIVGNALLGGVGGIASVALIAGLSRLFFNGTLLATRVTALMVPRVIVVLVGVIVLFPLLARLDEMVGRRPEGETL